MAAVINNQQTAVGTGATTIYTGSSAGSVVTRIDFSNTGGSPTSLTVTIAGQTFVSGKQISVLGSIGIPNSPDEPLAGRYVIDFGAGGLLLKSGQTITAQAGAISSINAFVCAVDLS